MKFNLNGLEIASIIELIDNSKSDDPYLKHIKNLLYNRRGSKQHTKKELIEMILDIRPDYDVDKLQELDDRKLYNIAIALEMEEDNIENYF